MNKQRAAELAIAELLETNRCRVCRERLTIDEHKWHDKIAEEADFYWEDAPSPICTLCKDLGKTVDRMFKGYV